MTKLNDMGKIPIWINHPLYGKVWTSQRRGLVPKSDYLINSSKRTSHASHDEAEDEPFIGKKVWVPKKRETDPKRYCLINSPKRTLHVFHDEVEHHRRSPYMDKRSTMLRNMDTSEKRVESKKGTTSLILRNICHMLP